LASGILALLDDIALLADDVAASTKIATQKTAAILGDDVAVGAEKATGFSQKRELIVIWAITKGSLLNKVIVLPMAFLLSLFLPWMIPIILIIGGLYLLYEGAEKVEDYLHKQEDSKSCELLKSSTNENVVEIEKQKIKSAIMTDFILSVEIVILALNSVIDQPLLVQVASTTAVALLATFGVYGLVALIVRIDNVGFWFIDKDKVAVGNFLVSLMPKIIKLLGVIGTIAMILVGGGILTHNIELIHHLVISSIPLIVFEFLVGIVVGFVVLISVKLVQKYRSIRI
jgi:predicted DNA repair protein MutK